MSEPIQLKNAGDKHTMDVASCEELPFGKYKEYEFVGRDGSKVRVPKASAERQLSRLELNPDSVVGRRVTLKRDASADPAKPFWGIYLENGNGGTGGTSGAATAAAQPATSALEGHTAAPAQPTSPLPSSNAGSGTVSHAPDKPHVIYEKITAWVLKDIVPMYEAAGVTMTDRGVAAICNTLFINRLG